MSPSSSSNIFTGTLSGRIILITGCEGFVGSHLAEHLVREYPRIALHGTRRPKASTDNVAQILPSIHMHEVDVTDAASVYQLLEALRPEVIFHLAAQSYVRTSWESPQATLTTNILGTANVLEALRELAKNQYNPITVLAGSSEEYGQPAQDELPLREEAPLRPLSPYAVSKIGQDLLGYQYFRTYGLKIVRLRIFNHTGPRRPTAFGDSALAHTIALIEQKLAPPVITYRNLEAVRDFTDVRDIARAYVLAAQYCTPGEAYNVCSGQGTTIKQIYKTLLKLSTMRNISLIPDPAGPRPTDGGIVIGDGRRFRKKTTWEPRIPFLKQTLPDILTYWRKQVERQNS